MSIERPRLGPVLPLDRRIEWVLAIALAVISMVAVAVWGRDLWHRADAFDFLMRRDVSLDSLLTAHEGHLQTPNVLLYLALHPIFGIDAPLAYSAPRLIGFAVTCLVTWRVMLWRGADRGVAFAMFCLMLFLGVSDFLYAAVFGVFLVIPVLAIAGWLLESRRDGPTRRDLIAMTAVLTIGVVSTSSGVAVVGAAVVVIALTPHLRRWWPSLVAPLLVYSTWYLAYGGGESTSGLSIRSLLSVPYEGAALLAGALADLSGLPPDFGPALLMALTGFGLWLIGRGAFSSFDALYLTTLVLFVALVVVFRVEAREIDVTLTRYAFVPTVLLIPVFAPKIRLPALPIRWAAIALIVGVALPGNIIHLTEGLDSWESRSQNVYEEVSTVAALIDVGEPAIPQAMLNRSLTGILQVADVARMKGPSWPPSLTDDPNLLSDARAAMRMEIVAGANEAEGDPLTTPREVTGGCTDLAPGKTQRFTVVGQGAVALSSDGPTRLRLTWTDVHGVAIDRFAIDGRRHVTYAEPDGPTELAMKNLGSAAVGICGVQSG